MTSVETSELHPGDMQLFDVEAVLPVMMIISVVACDREELHTLTEMWPDNDVVEMLHSHFIRRVTRV